MENVENEIKQQISKTGNIADDGTELARIQFISNYIGDLRAQTGYYIGYIPNAYADQPSADNFYEIIGKDPIIKHCSHLLSLMAAGERIKIKHKNPNLVKIVSNMLRGVHDFLHARKSLIEKGMVFGLGIQQKHFRLVEWEDFPYLKWIVPSRLSEVDRRRLRIERDVDDRNEQYWTIYSPKYDQYQVMVDRNNDEDSESLAVQDFLWYVHEYEELSPYFQGFGDILYPLAYIKNKAWQYWADLCESWSKPFLLAQIDVMRGVYDAIAGNGMVTESERKEKIIQEMETWRARHVAIADKNDVIQWHEHGSSGTNVISQLMDECNKQIKLIFFGTELSTGTGQGQGSYALGAVHKEASDTIITYNRTRLAETIQLDLIHDFLWRNRKNLEILGIKMPEPFDIELEITVDSEQAEKQQQAQQGGGQNPHIPGGLQ